MRTTTNSSKLIIFQLQLTIMVQFRYAMWNKLQAFLNFMLIIIIFHHSNVSANHCLRQPYGRVVVRDSEVQCKKFQVGKELSIGSCSKNIYKNGTMLNKTNLNLVTSLANYGVYRCCRADGPNITYIVFPNGCNGKSIIYSSVNHMTSSTDLVKLAS